MKRLLILLALIFVLTCQGTSYAQRCEADGTELARLSPAIVGGGVPSGDYCSGTTWNTYTNFRLDFDHTTNNATACIGASSTEVGTATNTPTITASSVNPPTGSSDGNALIPDAASEYYSYTANASTAINTYGSLLVKFRYDDTTAQNLSPVTICYTGDGTCSDTSGVNNYIKFYITSVGVLQVGAEGGSLGGVAVGTGDISAQTGDWVQVNIRWDSTRCTAEPCADAGEDEVCIRYRYDSDNNGSWDGPGADPYWSAWECDTDTDDFGSFAGNFNVIRIGWDTATFDYAIELDDIEISTAQPTWD